MITTGNYEEYMAMHADGELQPREVEALLAFLNEHPHLAGELALYEQVKLQPDYGTTYAQKDTLLREEPARKIALFTNWRTYSAAAGIALLLVIGGVTLREQNKTAMPAAIPAADHDTAAPVDSVPGAEPSVTSVDPAVRVAFVKAFSQTPVVRDVNRKDSRRTATANAATTMPHLALEPVTVAAVSRLQTAAPNTGEPPLVNLDAFELPEISAPVKKSWLEALPVNDLKKQGLANVGSVIATGYEEVAHLKQNISDKSLTIKIQQRKLILSF